MHDTQSLVVSDLAPRRSHIEVQSALHGDAPVQLFGSLGQVPAAAWDAVAAGHSQFLERRYLHAMEAGAGEELTTWYALLHDQGRPAGIACFHLTDFVGQPLEPLLARAPALVSFLARQLGLLGQPLRVKLLVCGNPFTSGAHGFALRPEVPAERAASLLVAAAEQVQAGLPEPERAQALLFKDFGPASDRVAERLTDGGFCRLVTEPGMVLTLDPAWTRHADYLDSLTSHFRVKARRVYARSAELTVRELDEADLAALRGPLAALQGAVLDRADHRLGRLGLPAYAALRRALGPDLVLRGYFLGDRLVGYTSGVVLDGALVAQCVGIDYALNHDLGIYPRMLHDYIALAIDRRLDRVDYGRTASEIKSTLGAEPVALHCWVRHASPALNRLLPPVARFIAPPAYAHRRPFRQAERAPKP